MALIFSFSGQASSISPLAVENGITIVSGKAGWGGSFIRNTSITGAFIITFAAASMKWTTGNIAVGTDPDLIHKIYGFNNITNPTNGTAAGLFQTVCAPTANISGVTNIYGAASTLTLNLAAGAVTTPEATNVCGHLASLVLSNNSGVASTGPMSASRAGVVLNAGNLGTIADLRIYNVRAFEDLSTGGTISAAYGLYIESLKIARITTAYGIYQAGANDLNFFAGISRFGGNTFSYSGIIQINSTISGPGGFNTGLVVRGIAPSIVFEDTDSSDIMIGVESGSMIIYGGAGATTSFAGFSSTGISTGGSVTTGAPITGTAAPWKLGVKVDAAVALDATKYIQVDISGTLYKLGIVA